MRSPQPIGSLHGAGLLCLPCKLGPDCAPPYNYCIASFLCPLQSRLCVQAPLQALLCASNASALLRSCQGTVSEALRVGGTAVTAGLQSSSCIHCAICAPSAYYVNSETTYSSPCCSRSSLSRCCCPSLSSTSSRWMLAMPSWSACPCCRPSCSRSHTWVTLAGLTWRRLQGSQAHDVVLYNPLRGACCPDEHKMQWTCSCTC